MTSTGGVPLRERLDGGVLWLELARPEKKNALNRPLVEALHAALDRAELDPLVRVVVVTGAGADFCAGADLAELLASADRPTADNEAEALRLGQLFVRLRELPKVAVAAVRGRALAGGAGLATACDLVVASATASFGYPEVARGFVPAMVMTMLRRAVGEKVALDLVLTGRVLGAGEAEARGLVSRVIPEESFDAELAALLAQLASRSPTAIALTKRLLHDLADRSFSEGIVVGAKVNAVARSTPEFRALIQGFLRR